MNVELQLPAHIERQLILRANATGRDVAAVVGEVVTEAFDVEQPPPSSAESADERAERFGRRLDAWTAMHPVVNHFVDDSRESIYAGCGE